jgi:hypothetical protein
MSVGLTAVIPFLLLLQPVPRPGEKAPLPHRWAMVRTQLESDADVEKIRGIAETAASHGLNGILLGAGLDSLDALRPERLRRLQAVRRICSERRLDLIPSVFAPGYGGGLLGEDPHLAEGLPVENALFVVRNGEASLQADPPVSLRNGGFEEWRTQALPGFEVSGGVGRTAFADAGEVREGKVSLRLENFASVENKAIRIGQWVKVQPRRLYRLRCQVKARDLRASDPFGETRFQIEVLGGEETSPVIQLLPGGAIREGERLRVGFYHSVFIYNDQVPLCLSEPRAYELWNERVRTIEGLLAPRAWFLNADEHRALGTCQACKRSGRTLGAIQADSLTRQYRMIRALNPQAEVFVWSDMFDPHHNAGTDRKWYYLTEGSFADSWKEIPKDLVIVCWYFERREASLKHADDLSNPRDWLKSLAATPGAAGILYTTWLDKYELLGAFGDLVSGRK